MRTKVGILQLIRKIDEISGEEEGHSAPRTGGSNLVAVRETNAKAGYYFSVPGVKITYVCMTRRVLAH